MARKRAAAKPSKAQTDPALLRAATDGAAIQMRDKTIALGHFSGVTGNGFRLICEDGSLVLIATSDKPLTSSLTRAVTTRCKWIVANRDVVDARWRAVVGPALPPPALNVRVVVHGTDKKCEQQLARISAPVQIRVYRLVRNGGKVDSRFTTIDLPPSPAAHPHLAALLLEARCAARTTLARDLPRDPIDWRTSRDYQLLRVYGLLVTAASLLNVQGTQSRSTSSQRSTRGFNAFHGLRDDLLPMLGSFAHRLARNTFASTDRQIVKTLQSLCDLVGRLYGDGVGHSAGEFAGEYWKKSPIPPHLHILLTNMSAPLTGAELKDALVAPRGRVATWLSDTNVAIASAVCIGQSFDGFREPRDSTSRDNEYFHAALVRVLSAHRVLLELLALSDRKAVLAILAMANEFSMDDKTFEAFLTGGEQGRRMVQELRENSLAVLNDDHLGKLTRRGKHPAALVDSAVVQETSVLKAIGLTLQHFV